MTQALLYTDGGSRGNPGPSGIGYVLMASENSDLTTLSEGGAFIGEATNNEAEYQALLWGLVNARALAIRHLSIRADSELMVKQIKGEYKVRSVGIKPLYELVCLELAAFASYEIAHVRREDNARADALANEAMDVEWSIGSYQVPFALPQGTLTEATEAACGEEEGMFVNHSVSLTGSPLANVSLSPLRGIYTLTVKDHFDAAHALAGYPGECCKLHGHTWDVEVSVSGSELDEVGIVYDFKTLKADLAAILAPYDHAYLGEVPPFDRSNATAENLARTIYEALEERLPAHIDLEEVAVWESPIAKLTYRKT